MNLYVEGLSEKTQIYSYISWKQLSSWRVYSYSVSSFSGLVSQIKARSAFVSVEFLYSEVYMTPSWKSLLKLHGKFTIIFFTTHYPLVTPYIGQQQSVKVNYKEKNDGTPHYQYTVQGIHVGVEKACSVSVRAISWRHHGTLGKCNFTISDSFTQINRRWWPSGPTNTDGCPQQSPTLPESQGLCGLRHSRRSHYTLRTVCWWTHVAGEKQRGNLTVHGPLTRYVKLRVAHAPGMQGTFSPPPRVGDPDMHHGTCVTHVPCACLDR